MRLRWLFDSDDGEWSGYSKTGENVVSVFGEFTSRGGARFAVRLWEEPCSNRTTHKTLEKAKAVATKRLAALSQEKK